MRKGFCVFAACICFGISTFTVHADLIWEPYSDPFYQEYADMCVYENSTYIANGPDGTVTVFESPQSTEKVTVWENGKSAYISFIYTDETGAVWGVYDNGDVNESGWVYMEHMIRKYDYRSFEEEFGEWITEETGEISPAEYAAVYFWKYPGSDEGSYINLYENPLAYSQTFVDEEGRRWGYVAYYYGTKNVWVCLDAPTDTYEELYPEDAPARGTVLESTGAVVDMSETQQKTMEEAVTAEKQETADVPLVTGIVLAVVAVTGGLLALLKRSFHAKK